MTDHEWNAYRETLKRGNFIKLCRLRFLNPDGSTAFVLDNDPYQRGSGAFIAAGNMNVNLQNGTRRTADDTLDNVDGAFDYNYNKVWFGTEIALDMGVVLPDGTEFYLPQGVFRVVSPRESVTPDGRTAQHQLSDKWAGLDGTLNGVLESSYVVNEGTNIFAPIVSILASDRGDGQPYDTIPPVFTEYYNGKTQSLPQGGTAALTDAPYQLVIDSEDGSVGSLILGLTEMVNAWVGYDQTGTLRIDPSQDDIDDGDKPVLWRFNPGEFQLISLDYESAIADVVNDYIVVGMMADDNTQPAARVQNLDPTSDTNVNLIGRRTKRESRPEFATETICRDYAVWMVKRQAALHKRVQITCNQIFHLEENGLIELPKDVLDENGNVIDTAYERYLIQSFSLPFAGDQPMSITATSVNDFPNVTVTTWPPAILYELSESDFSRELQNYGGYNSTPPYTKANPKRISYVDFDLLFDGGKTYKIIATATKDTANMGIQLFNAALLNDVANHNNLAAADIYDLGWRNLSVTIAVPATYNNSAIKGCRITFRESSEAPDISSDFKITKLTIQEVTA